MTTEVTQQAMISLSDIDEQRFGCCTAKATNITCELLPAVMRFCRDNAVRLLIARCSNDDIHVAHAMEQHGFQLMDSLVYYMRDLTQAPIPQDAGRILICPMQPGEEAVVGLVARDAFHNYVSHYHADPRLDSADCDETYGNWAETLARSRSESSEVFIAARAGVIVGFAVVRLNTPYEGEGVLYGVAPAARGNGIHSSLLIATMNWLLRKGAQRMLISTQINNVQAQRNWSRLGFEPYSGYYTFHKWFDAV